MQAPAVRPGGRGPPCSSHSAYWVMCQWKASEADRPWYWLPAVEGSITPTLTQVVSAPPAAASGPADSPWARSVWAVTKAVSVFEVSEKSHVTPELGEPP